MNRDMKLRVDRPLYQVEDLNKDTLYELPHSTIKEKIINTCKSISLLSWLYRTVPILQWMPDYSWKKDIFGDLISGVTMAIMHIPQGMAYGLLGGLPPIVGIYMAFYPVLVYFIFGTSRHVSIGTFAIVSLMVGKVVDAHATFGPSSKTGVMQRIPDVQDLPGAYTNIDVAITLSFVAAIFQMIMYVLRLGIVSTLLSDTLINGFMCAAAYQVVSSQLKDLLGVPIPQRRGNFSLILTVYESYKALPKANTAVIKVSAITVLYLFLNNDCLNPWLKQRIPMPIPGELIAVIFGTFASHILSFEEKCNISTVGFIPTGLPDPVAPKLALIPEILFDSFLIMIVAYTVTLSMALIFARKQMYEVDSNQELLAMGLSNLMGSFFSCMPVAASLSRSVVQEAVGGVTQITSVIASILLLFVLLWIGPAFQSLPRCILAAVIVVALNSLLLQITAFIRYWKLSRWDGIIWIVTFLTTIIFQITVGLIVGIIMSCMNIFVQGYTVYTCLLGNVPNTDLYLDIGRYKKAQEIDDFKIIHYSGALSFATRASFRDMIIETVDMDPPLILRKRTKLQRQGLADNEQLPAKAVILDFSCLTYLDPSGVECLQQMRSEYEDLGVLLYIAGCSGPVFEVMERYDRTDRKKSNFMMFHTVHDAVVFAQARLLSDKKKP